MTKEETKRRAEIMLAAEYDGDICVNIECKSNRSGEWTKMYLSLIHISEPTRPY